LRHLIGVAFLVSVLVACESPVVEIQLTDRHGVAISNAPVVIRASSRTTVCQRSLGDGQDTENCGAEIHTLTDQEGRVRAGYIPPLRAPGLFCTETANEWIEIEYSSENGETLRTRTFLPAREVHRERD